MNAFLPISAALLNYSPLVGLTYIGKNHPTVAAIHLAVFREGPLPTQAGHSKCPASRIRPQGVRRFYVTRCCPRRQAGERGLVAVALIFRQDLIAWPAHCLGFGCWAGQGLDHLRVYPVVNIRSSSASCCYHGPKLFKRCLDRIMAHVGGVERSFYLFREPRAKGSSA